MMDLYFADSGNSLRALLVLEECGLPYVAHRLDLTKAEQRAADFLGVNPFGTVPTMRDPDPSGGTPVTLTQSAAIMIYLAEKADRLIPKQTTHRAQMMNWLMMGASDLGPANTLILYMSRSVPDLSEAGRSFLIERFLRYVRGVEAHLSTREESYMVGYLTLADLALFPAIRMRRGLLENLREFPRVMSWMDRLAARPAFQRAIAALSAGPGI